VRSGLKKKTVSKNVPNRNQIFLLERVSKPMIHWECPNTTLTCAVLQGTDFELKLYQGETLLNSLPQKNMSYQWTNLNAPFKCEAINPVSKESKMEVVNCPGKVE
jgi:CD2 antigen